MAINCNDFILKLECYIQTITQNVQMCDIKTQLQNHLRNHMVSSQALS